MSARSGDIQCGIQKYKTGYSEVDMKNVDWVRIAGGALIITPLILAAIRMSLIFG